MKLTYIKQTGEPNGDAGDQYTGLDRFGRVVDQRWPEGSSELERVDYGFTAGSNRQWRQNRVAAGGQDEYYNYDGLYQVAELNRGTLPVRLRTRILSERFFIEEQGRTVEVVSEGLNEAGR